MNDEAGAVVLFDGVCNLCNGSVGFILDHDPKAYFRFASLQSSQGRALLTSHGIPPATGDPDSIILVENGRVYQQSTAALRIAKKLRGMTSWLYAFIIVPQPIRDFFYRVVARNRYRWFGKTDACRLPTPALKSRFLDQAN